MATATAVANKTSSSVHVPALDGWRGIAILLVLAEHIENLLYGGFRYFIGQHGVTIFFVLSGYLITNNLLRNERPKLRQFYIRRFFRLMPAAWSYLIFILAFGAMYRLRLTTWSEVLSCVSFWRNYYHGQVSVATYHFWSLSIEEQFYLVWPFLLVWLGAKRIRYFACGMVLLVSGWRYGHWEFYDRRPLCFATQARVDAILIGCLLALVMEEEWFYGAIDRFGRLLSIVALSAFVWAIYKYQLLPPTFECVSIAILIAVTVRSPNRFPAKILKTKALVALGVLSYSIYVWQQFFLLLWAGRLLNVIMLAVLPFVVVFSYFVIEKPIREFGRRVAGH